MLLDHSQAFMYRMQDGNMKNLFLCLEKVRPDRWDVIVEIYDQKYF